MTAATQETTTAEEPTRPADPPDVITVRGIADISGGRGHLLARGYRRSPGDIPLPAAMIGQYGLRRGDEVEGTVTAPAGGAGRAAALAGITALTGITAINGLAPAAARRRPAFDDLTPLYPTERLRLEDGDSSSTARIIDLLSPIGKGQRGIIETGSQLDTVLFEEFKGTGNMELRLRRDLAEKRLFPAIDPAPSGTRRDDLLMDPAEHEAVVSLRRALAALDPQHAMELLLDKTRQPNAQFLRQVHAAR